MNLHPYFHGLDRAARLAFIKSYPFGRADTSFLFLRGEALPIIAHDLARFENTVVASLDGPCALGDMMPAEDLERLELRGPLPTRLPFVAVGSNASPAQLKRKYGTGDVAIPTFQARLTDFAIVHSAMFNYYCVIPATLFHEPGGAVDLWVNFISRRDIEVMDRTELVGDDYRAVDLVGLDCRLSGGEVLPKVHAYVAVNGPLDIGGGPALLSSVAHHGHDLPALSQAEVLTHLHRRLGIMGELDEFLEESLRDHDLRNRRDRIVKDTLSLPMRLP